MGIAKTMFGRLVPAVLLASFVTVAAPAGPGRALAQDAALLDSAAPDRQARLEAAARKEGALALYTSIAQKDLPPLIQAFEKRYGVKVNVWRASGGKGLQKIIEEQKAGRYSVDVVHTSGPELEILHREKLLQPVASPYFGDLVPGGVPAHREYATTLLSVFVQAYNTGLLTRDALPRTYQDLLNPRWKGMLGYEAEDIEWFATVADVVGGGGAAGVRYFRDLVAGNGLSVRKGHTLLTNLVVSGEVPLALTLYNYMPAQAKKKGAPIDWFVIEPAVARTNGVAVMKNARSPNAAALFEDFMLSEGQGILLGLDYVPATTKLASPLGTVAVRLVDPVDAIDKSAAWEPLYDEIILKQAR